MQKKFQFPVTLHYPVYTYSYKPAFNTYSGYSYLNIFKQQLIINKMKKALFIVAIATGSLFFYSCSKQDILHPAPVQQPVSSGDDQDAVARTSPAPGNYKVQLYIDDNDTSTFIFKGYVFNFNGNGTLTATVNKKVYKGKWQMKDAGSEIKLEIEGTAALEKIDKSWDVVKITATLITLTDNDPGEITKLIFRKI